MAVLLKLSQSLQRFSSSPELSLEPGTIGDLLEQLKPRDASLFEKITDQDGRLLRSVKIFVDNVAIDALDGERTIAKSGVQVRIIVASSGG
jgi:molybdopterin converting factor small subunit